MFMAAVSYRMSRCLASIGTRNTFNDHGGSSIAKAAAGTASLSSRGTIFRGAATGFSSSQLAVLRINHRAGPPGVAPGETASMRNVSAAAVNAAQHRQFAGAVLAMFIKRFSG